MLKPENRQDSRRVKCSMTEEMGCTICYLMNCQTLKSLVTYMYQMLKIFMDEQLATVCFNMLETRHHWLPIIIAVYLPLSFGITLWMAIEYDHVEPAFPYISYTGTKPPESCVFSQLVNIGAVLAGIIVYVRYRQGLHHFEKLRRRCLIHLNTAAFIVGMLSTLGVSMVANFQVSNISKVHYIGAFLAFVVGYVYLILQTIISLRSAAFGISGNILWIRRFRLGLCVADGIFLVLIIAAASEARSKGPGPGKSKRCWSADDPGYAEHVVATTSEWLISFVTVIYFATFYAEFKHFRMKAPEVVSYNEEHQSTEIPAVTDVSVAVIS